MIVISCHTHLLFDENIFDLTLVCYGDLRHTGLNQIRNICLAIPDTYVKEYDNWSEDEESMHRNVF